jgi:enoyl-CoA hydratase
MSDERTTDEADGGAGRRGGDRDTRDAGREPGTGGRGGSAPSGADAVSVTRDGPVTTVVLSRPHARNAVDGPTADALAAAFRAFDADDDAAVAVLHGDGGTFCAGADLKALGTARSNRMEPLPADGPMGPTRLRLSKPVVASIAGHAVAGGLELAAWCDLRVADEDAILGVFCRRWGVPLIDGGTFRLARLIGESRAMDLVLTGRPVAADEALAIGLVNRVVPRGGSLAAAQQLASQLAAFPQTCLRSDRAALLDTAGRPEDDALAVEYDHGLATLGSGESLEGASRVAGGAGRGGAF